MRAPVEPATIEPEHRATFSASEALFQRAQKRLVSGIAHDSRYLKPFPIYAESASRARKRTVERVELVDFALGHGSLLFGHNPSYAVEVLDLGFVEPFDRPSSAGIPSETLSTVVVAGADAGAVEATLAGGEIAGLVLEPGGGSASCVPPDREFLQRGRELTERADTLLIFDEVVSGFTFRARRRTGMVWGHARRDDARQDRGGRDACGRSRGPA